MSELKAHNINDLSMIDIINCDFYFKSEADKVIAEKDKEIARLNDKALQYKVLDKEHCRDLNTQERLFALQMAHHKFKRCLAMAEWCEERSARYDLLQEHSGFSWRREIDFYFRWYQRWLKIAEQFKEATNGL